MIVSVELLDALTALVLRGAAAVKAAPAGRLRLKADQSPVTAADEAAEAAILRDLPQILPGVPVVSEEAGAPPGPLGSRFLLLDPLDGTREFVAGRDEYTINLALVQDGVPVLGVVSAPALDLVWRGAAGMGAERLTAGAGDDPRKARAREPIRTRPRPTARPVVTVSRSHLDPDTQAFVGRLAEAQLVPAGSAVKLCRIAEGAADVYPRLAPTSEWDIAAGHAVITAAGGQICTPEGAPLRYGAADRRFLIPAFIAWGDPAWAAEFHRAGAAEADRR